MYKKLGLLLLISCIYTHKYTDAHECIHDEVQRSKYRLGKVSDAEAGVAVEDGEVRHATVALGASHDKTLTTHVIYVEDSASYDAMQGPIRIAFRTNHLFDSRFFCTSAVGSVPDFLGGSINCTSDNILTDKKRDALINVVFPEVVNLVAGFISVTNVATNLPVPTLESCGKQYELPDRDRIMGIPNADIAIYVTAAPIKNAAASMFASFCSIDAKGRPMVSAINIAPAHIGDMTSASVKRRYVYITLHNLFHLLGFNVDYISTNWFGNGQRNYITKSTRRGKDVTLYNGQSALIQAKQYYKCGSLDGLEFQHNNDSHIASHWSKRDHRDDLMSVIEGEPGAISRQTLGLLEDSGHYVVDMSKAENVFWGARSGCGLFTDKCNTASGGLGRLFCNQGREPQCSPDLKSYGMCDLKAYNADLPAWAQYVQNEPRTGGSDELMDYCPVVKNDNSCTDPNTVNPYGPGEMYYGYDSRCVSSTFRYSYMKIVPGMSNIRCLRVNCVRAARIVVVGVNNNAYYKCLNNGETFYAGSMTGKPNDIADLIGSITCPKYEDVCEGVGAAPDFTSFSVELYGHNHVMFGLILTLIMILSIYI